LLTLAYAEFQDGNKKQAIRLMVQAMENEDFANISNGLTLMNSRNSTIIANDESDEEDTNPDKNDSDIDEVLDNPSDDSDKEDSTTDDNELSDDDLDKLMQEDPNSDSSDEENTDSDDSSDEEDTNPEDVTKPMGGVSSVTASDKINRTIANKLATSGGGMPDALIRAKQFIEKRK
jgi:hypothetical protein